MAFMLPLGTEFFCSECRVSCYDLDLASSEVTVRLPSCLFIILNNGLLGKEGPTSQRL